MTASESTLSPMLDGLRVLCIGQGIAFGYAGRLLAGLGATVTKVEPPDGDFLRRHGLEDDEPGPSPLFQHLNGETRSLPIDVGHPDGRALVGELAANVSDSGGPVLVDEGLGSLLSGPFDLDGLAVVLKLVDVADDGPLHGQPMSDLTVQALSGWVSPRGILGVPPVQVGGYLHEYAVGVYVAAAALAAVRWYRLKGTPQTVELDRMTTVFNTVAYDMLRRETLQSLGYTRQTHTAYIPGVLSCRDGQVAVNCLTGQHWMDLCALLGVPQFEDRYIELRYDGTEMANFRAAIDPWFAGNEVAEVIDLCQAFRIPASPITTGATAELLPPFAERDFFRSGTSGQLEPGLPFRVTRSRQS